jgi:hypothetical protein
MKLRVVSCELSATSEGWLPDGLLNGSLKPSERTIELVACQFTIRNSQFHGSEREQAAA